MKRAKKEEPKGLALEYMPLGELQKWPKNPKAHDIDGLIQSFRRRGFVQPITIDEATQRMIAGHGRQESLSKMKVAGELPPTNIQVRTDGEWMVPVIRGNRFSSEEEAERYLIYDNRAVEKSGWNAEPLLEMIGSFESPDLDSIGFTQEELDDIHVESKKVSFDASTEVGDEDVVDIEVPKDPTTKVGDLWKLGRHLLLCGDSTKPEHVGRLFVDGAKARLLSTDPPYGVDYTAVKNGIPRSGFDKIVDDWGHIEADSLDGPALQAFLESVFRAALPFLDRAAWYLWHAQMTQGYFSAAAAAAAAQAVIHRQIVWVKPNFVLTRSGMWHWRHELAYFAWVKGQQPPWYGEKNQTSVWEVGHDSKTRIHPTQKPVELFARPIRNHLLKGEVSYEPFAGSGSHIIAAERCETSCRALELSPGYCDAIVQRWETETGGKAQLKKGAVAA